MKTKYHLSLDIEGGMQHAKDLVGAITLDDGKTLNTVKEVKDFLKDCLKKGWKSLPCGDCDNFDYQTGCKGHPVPDEEPTPTVPKPIEEYLDKKGGILPDAMCEKVMEKNIQNLETKHHSPEVYRLYDYLKANHLGKENGIKKPELAEKLGIKARELRKLTKEINESTELEKLVSTSHCCYMCKTKEECEKSIRTTYKVAVALFKKAKQMEKKVGLNGQMKIKLGKYYKDFVETFSSEE